MKFITLFLMLVMLSGCATTKIPKVTNINQNSGQIEVSYEYLQNLEKPVVKWDTSLTTANAQCQAWGYSGAESQTTTQNKCIQAHKDGSCMTQAVSANYTCIRKDVVKVPTIKVSNQVTKWIEMEYEYTPTEKPVVDLEAAKKVANEKCKELGFKPIENKEEQSSDCASLQLGSGAACTKNSVKITFECQLTKEQLAKKLEEERVRKEKEIAEEKKRNEEFAKEYPFTAILKCGRQGYDGILHNDAGLMVCLAGGSRGVNTELEITNGGEYGLYKPWDINRIGEHTREGVYINLHSNFFIKAQNAHDYVTLGIEVIENKTKKVIYQKQVSKYGVIVIKN